MSQAETANQLIGVTTCEYCGVRLRLRKQHARLVGRTVRCPKCHREFTLQLERPTNVERAAIDNASTEKRRKRRTKAQIRRTHVKRIKDGFRAYHGRLKRIATQATSSEEEVRRWCIDVLREAVGYKDNEIDTELRALNKRIDIALHKDGKVFMVIECKNIRSRLRENVTQQAACYAANRSADWAVVTNGQIWRLYRVYPVRGKDPRVVQVFDLALLDDDGVSDEDVELLYLLTPRALFTGATEKYYHKIASTSDDRLLKGLMSDRVVRSLCRELKESYQQDNNTRVQLDRDVVAARVRDMFLPGDL